VKAILLMADGFSNNRDNTISVLRSGVNVVNFESGKPLVYSGWLIVYVRADPGESGEQMFTLKVVKQSGESFGAPDMSGSLIVPSSDGIAQVGIQFGLQFPEVGQYKFIFEIPGKCHDAWAVLLKVEPPTARG